ncbi:MAG: hypothetical protein MHM6MM_003329 [Cercozoa sp. M6MM]
MTVLHYRLLTAAVAAGNVVALIFAWSHIDDLRQWHKDTEPLDPLIGDMRKTVAIQAYALMLGASVMSIIGVLALGLTTFALSSGFSKVGGVVGFFASIWWLAAAIHAADKFSDSDWGTEPTDVDSFNSSIANMFMALLMSLTGGFVYKSVV